jgi:hypothetical protein
MGKLHQSQAEEGYIRSEHLERLCGLAISENGGEQLAQELGPLAWGQGQERQFWVLGQYALLGGQ